MDHLELLSRKEWNEQISHSALLRFVFGGKRVANTTNYVVIIFVTFFLNIVPGALRSHQSESGFFGQEGEELIVMLSMAVSVMLVFRFLLECTYSYHAINLIWVSYNDFELFLCHSCSNLVLFPLSPFPFSLLLEEFLIFLLTSINFSE